MVRIGFIGCGNHAGGSLYPAFRQALFDSHRLTGRIGELVAVCDIREEAARAYGRAFGARDVYTDYHEMLDKAELDCVFVVMHPKQQCPIGMDCLRAGKHVFVEKPPAETLVEARQMKRVAEQHGKHLMVGFMKRFSQPYQKAKQIVGSEAFGEPSMLEMRFTYGKYPTDVYDFLTGFNVHMFDLARFFMGDVQSVYAEMVRREPGREGYAITFRFTNGALGVQSTNCLDRGPVMHNYGERVAIDGVGSSVIVENWRRVIGHIRDREDVYFWEPEDGVAWDRHDRLRAQGYVGEIRHFVECVRDNRKPESSIDDGIEAMRIIAAVKASIDKGHSARLADVRT